MKESLYIKNLGPIKNVELLDIKDFTVFIGESGSGKSTIMKAIGLFRWLYKMQNIKSYLKHSNISKTPFQFRIDEYLKNCGFEQFINNKTEIIYKTELDSGNGYELKYANNKLSGISNSDLIDENDICFNKISFISETRNIISLWAAKGASLAGGYLGFYFHEVYNDFEKATDTLKELPVSYLNINFSVKKTKMGKKFSIRSTGEDDYEIDLKNSSSGTQTSIPISVLSNYFSSVFSFEDAFNRSVLNYLSNTDKLTDFKPVKNLSEIVQKAYIHIEEPELSLYPDAQCLLINDVVENCFLKNKHDVGLILSTHSPYIINHLNLLIKAYDTKKTEGAKLNYDNLSVYQVEKGNIIDLKIKNERLINTNPLSETIDRIYDAYNKLDEVSG